MPTDYTLWTLVINLMLTVVTLAIAIAAIVQAVAAKRAADVAQSSLIATQRPKLVVKHISLIPGKLVDVNETPTLQDDRQWRIACVVANIGGSTAQISESSLTIKRLGIGSLEGLLPTLPPYDKRYSFGQFSIEPGERKERIVVLDANTDTMNLRLVHAMAEGGSNTSTSPLICFGFFHYRDKSGIGRLTGFGARWNAKDMSFSRLEDSNYEYAD